MKKSTKRALLVCKGIEVIFAYLLYEAHKEEIYDLKKKIKEAYNKGRMDCVDDFVKGFVFTNGDKITIESEHNGSIVVQTVR